MQQKKVIYNFEQIQRSLFRISHEILEKNPNINSFYIFGIENKGSIVAKRIVEIIKTLTDPLQYTLNYQSIDINPFRDDYVDKNNEIKYSNILDDQVVIIIDDVLQTGRTARAAIEAVLTKGRPSIIQLATLVDRGHRELPIRPDYVGKNLPTSKKEFIQVNISDVENKDDCVILQKGEED